MARSRPRENRIQLDGPSQQLRRQLEVPPRVARDATVLHGPQIGVVGLEVLGRLLLHGLQRRLAHHQLQLPAYFFRDLPLEREDVVQDSYVTAGPLLCVVSRPDKLRNDPHAALASGVPLPPD